MFVYATLYASSSGECQGGTYSSSGALLVGGLAGDLESNVVGGVALELEGGGREVVEVLVEELLRANVSCVVSFITDDLGRGEEPGARFSPVRDYPKKV